MESMRGALLDGESASEEIIRRIDVDCLQSLSPW